MSLLEFQMARLRGVWVQLLSLFQPLYVPFTHRDVLLCRIIRFAKSISLGITVVQHVLATPAHLSGFEQHLSETNACKREENHTRALRYLLLFY